MNNKFLYGFISGLVIISIFGCSSIFKNNEGVFGKSSTKYTQADAEIRHTENSQAQSNEDKLAHIGAWSKGGVEYSLDQIKTNVPKEVVIAKEMNDRVEALAGKPDFKEVEAIKGIVDSLMSEVTSTKLEGQKALAVKDTEINQLEERMKQLNAQREEDIAKAMAQANVTAQKNDQLTATLGDMDKFFGLGAVFYGLKRFVISAAWGLGIGAVIYLLLRAFAASNPIVGSIFAIVERMFSWIINSVKLIAPRSTIIAGLTETSVFNGYKSTLHKIIDAIEIVKDRQSAVSSIGVVIPTVTPSSVVGDILTEAAKSMDQADKDRVTEAKKELHWK